MHHDDDQHPRRRHGALAIALVIAACVVGWIGESGMGDAIARGVVTQTAHSVGTWFVPR